jgi:hypothetical protein
MSTATVQGSGSPSSHHTHKAGKGSGEGMVQLQNEGPRFALALDPQDEDLSLEEQAEFARFLSDISLSTPLARYNVAEDFCLDESVSSVEGGEVAEQLSALSGVCARCEQNDMEIGRKMSSELLGAKFALAEAEAEREELADQLKISESKRREAESFSLKAKASLRQLQREIDSSKADRDRAVGELYAQTKRAETLESELKGLNLAVTGEELCPSGTLVKLIDAKVALATQTLEVDKNCEALKRMEEELVETKLALAQSQQDKDDVDLRLVVVAQERDALKQLVMRRKAVQHRRGLSSSFAMQFMRRSDVIQQDEPPAPKSEMHVVALVDGSAVDDSVEDEIAECGLLSDSETNSCSFSKDQPRSTSPIRQPSDIRQLRPPKSPSLEDRKPPRPPRMRASASMPSKEAVSRRPPRMRASDSALSKEAVSRPL